MDFNDFMKSISGGGDIKVNDHEIDQDLLELEAEVSKEEKGVKKKKKQSDDFSELLNDKGGAQKGGGNESDKELEALEDEISEGDEEMESNKKVPAKKPVPSKPQPASKPPAEVQRQNKPKEQPKVPQSQARTQASSQKPSVSSSEVSSKASAISSGAEKDDLYPEDAENKYHSIKFLRAMGVIEKEKELCDKIIAYKKKNKMEDYDLWEMKKDGMETYSTNTVNMIESGVLTLDKYKQVISKELENEKNLLVEAQKDKELSGKAKEIVIQRIKDRMNLIKEELEQQPEDGEEEEEEKKEEEKKVEKKVEKKEEEKKEQPKEAKKEAPKKESKDDKEKKVEKNVKESVKESVVVDKKSKEKKPVDQKLLARIKERFCDYKTASEYFQKNDFTDRQEDAIKKAKIIFQAIKKVEEGEDVNEFDLPNPITGEYICGMTKEKRFEKYKEIIKEYSNQKNEIIEGIKKLKAKFQTMSKVEQRKILPFMEKDVKEKNMKIEKYIKTIEKLKENCVNQFIPPPLFTKVIEEEKIEKINSDIKIYTLWMHFGKYNYEKAGLFMTVTLEYPEGNVKKENIHPKTKDNFDEIITWSFDKADFKRLYKKKVTLELFKKGFFKNEHKATGELNLNPLKSLCESKGNVEFKLDSNRLVPYVEVHLKVRSPCEEKEYISVPKEVFKVKRVYPEFKKDVSLVKSVLVSQVQPSADHPKPQPQPQPQKKPQPKPSESTTQKKSVQPPAKANPAPSQGHGEAHKALLERKVDRSNFTEEELKDPDIIENMKSVQVLEYKHKYYTDKSNKIEGRVPAALRQRIIKYKIQKTNLEGMLGEDISPEQYVEIMKSQLSHDELLLLYFIQQKDKEKAELVKVRVDLLKKEIKETEDYIKSGGN